MVMRWSEHREELIMYSLAKGLTGLAALAFVLAVAAHFMGGILSTSPGAFSRASNNLSLVAIALVVVFGNGTVGGRSGTLP
jgi:hypothetical protein